MTLSPFSKHVLHPGLILGMIICWALPAAAIAHLLDPAINSTLVISLCLLAALEAIAVQAYLHSRPMYSGRPLSFWIVELVFWFSVIKGLRYLSLPLALTLAEISRWSQDLLAIFDLASLITYLPVGLAWYFAQVFMDDLYRLDSRDDDRSTPATTHLTEHFLVGGMGLMLIVGLLLLGPEAIVQLNRPSRPGIVWNVLIYFTLGLILLGQVRYLSLRNEWQNLRIPLARDLPSRWLRYTLALIGLALLVAMLLPTGYTVGLFDLFNIMMATAWFVISLVIYLLGVFLTWLLPNWPQPVGPVFEPEKQPPIEPANLINLTIPEVLRSAFFWVVVIAILVYVIRAYLRDRGGLVQQLLKIKLLRTLYEWWLEFRSYLGQLARSVSAYLPRPLAERLQRQQVETPLTLLRLNTLSPREKVLYFYLNLLHRAEQAGLGRRPPQTPYEYDSTLAPHLSETQADLDQLTQAFVETRYGRQSISAEYARALQDRWQRLSAILKTYRPAKKKPPRPQ